jgi:hypothetical protein
MTFQAPHTFGTLPTGTSTAGRPRGEAAMRADGCAVLPVEAAG